MNSFWSPHNSIATIERLAPSTGDCGEAPEIVYCEILNGLEVLCAPCCAGRDRRDPFPVAQLKITLDGFDADYFSWGLQHFVSERLRQVMALDSLAVRFFEVDSSYSAPLPRSKNYQIMEVAATEDVVDPGSSDYELRPRLPGMDRDRINVRRYGFRPDAEPEHDLFYDRFSWALLCTEAFALRILNAGCTGMRFGDPNKVYIYRTLRGIEEYIDWDPVNRVEVTQVIQAIN